MSVFLYEVIYVFRSGSANGIQTEVMNVIPDIDYSFPWKARIRDQE